MDSIVRRSWHCGQKATTGVSSTTSRELFERRACRGHFERTDQRAAHDSRKRPELQMHGEHCELPRFGFFLAPNRRCSVAMESSCMGRSGRGERGQRGLAETDAAIVGRHGVVGNICRFPGSSRADLRAGSRSGRLRPRERRCRLRARGRGASRRSDAGGQAAMEGARNNSGLAAAETVPADRGRAAGGNRVRRRRMGRDRARRPASRPAREVFQPHGGLAFEGDRAREAGQRGRGVEEAADARWCGKSAGRCGASRTDSS